jgi:hypothetical protein
MLHLRELRLGHFRKGLGAVDRCDGAEGPLPPRAAINRRKLDRQLRGLCGHQGCGLVGKTSVLLCNGRRLEDVTAATDGR